MMVTPVMSRSLPPLRLLLYLEWILLGLSLLSTLLTPPFPAISVPPVLPLISIAAFGLMGLKLPTRRLRYKILYTIAEFGILLLPSILDYRMRFLPVLGAVVVLRACQMFRLPGRLVVTGLVFISLVGILFSRQSIFLKKHAALGATELTSSTILALKLNAVLSLGLMFAFVLLLVNALLAERQSRQELAIAHEQLRRYALRIENQATLQERNRIAREIHDSLGHSLTAQTIQLENALLFLSSNVDRAREFLLEAKQLSYQAVQDVSRSVATLRADSLRGQSLDTAIHSLLRDFRNTTNLVPDCAIDLTFPITPEVSIAFYRITQEALTNIAKHSDATQVILQLQAKAGQLTLNINDNGKGFDPQQNTTGFGLQSMRERAIALGGTLHVVSRPGNGCQIQAIVPLVRIDRSPLASLRNYDSSVSG
jgi:signal transduction histidine kinase